MNKQRTFNRALELKQTSIQHLNLTSYFPTSLPPRPRSHRQAEAAAALGAPEFPKGLLDSACGVETLGQQQDTIEEEK